MTRFLTLLLFSVSFASCEQSHINSDKDKERIDNVCDKFMQTFATGKISESLELLKQNSVMPPATIDSLQVIITEQANKLLPAYGKILSSEFITEKKIKD